MFQHGEQDINASTKGRFFSIDDFHGSLQVIGIYGYTIFAIQQERFLDDFDMPEEIDRTKKD